MTSRRGFDDMAPKSTQRLEAVEGGLPAGISPSEAALYIKELSQSLSDMAQALGHSRLAGLLSQASAEAGRLARKDDQAGH